MIRSLIIFLALTVSAMAQKQSMSSEPVVIVKARDAVTRALKYTEDVSFQNMREEEAIDVLGESMVIVCGMVSAKNNFGGYFDLTPFVYLDKTGDVSISSSDLTSDDSLLVRKCCPQLFK